MMEDLYALHSIANYSDLSSSMPPLDFVFPPNYQTTYSNSTDFSHRPPTTFGSERLVSVSSSPASESAPMLADLQRPRTTHSHHDDSACVIRSKIASHPLYPNLLEAFMDCQKVGAPPEFAGIIDEFRKKSGIDKRTAIVSTCLGADPELDEFMETYCGILVKYKSDLSRPFDEATSFLNDMEMQLNALCNGATTRSCISGEAIGSSEEDLSAEEVELHDFQPANEDRELKDKLLRKYSGYISSLKHEFSKKKKKGKLPKEARQILLDWWNIHYKWPYPTEADKIELAESTGLDQKQINNWFINQRKRHWKPSENMQFAVMDSLYGPLSCD